MAPPLHRAPFLLELDLTQPLLDPAPTDPIDKLRGRGKPRLADVLRALYDGAHDRHVVGLVAKLGHSLPLATVQELRAAVIAFADSGKPCVAWAETFGESANGTASYYLATGFREIWLQPSGELDAIGVALETTFLRGALDKLGIEPQLDQRHEYKNAADRIARTGFTAPHREALDRLAASTWEEVVAGIASGRGLSVADVHAYTDRAPLPAATALRYGLVDRLGYRDEVYADVRRRAGPTVKLLFADRWKPRPPLGRQVAGLARRRRGTVALVEGHGAIVTGRSGRSPLEGRRMGSDTVAAAFRSARHDDNVKAVVFRVDSPGGSYVASDTIWREVVVTREAGKPVVVSMGVMAGSGGYFVACPADVIVAQPATLTGSIGVFGGKAVITGLLGKAGLTNEAVAHGAHARMFSARTGFTDEERALLSQWLDEVYDVFTEKVATGRGMNRETVHAVAKGRVWTGADAVRNGLVDELGGLRDAARIARQRAGLPDDAALRPAVRVPPMARLRAPRSSDDPRSAAASVAAWGEFSGLAARLGLPATGPLTMPPVSLR